MGLIVAGFEHLASHVLLDQVLDAPLWLQAGAPCVGLAIAALALRAGGPHVTPATTDAYIHDFHERAGLRQLRAVPYRLAAAVATLGSGAPMGYEGPALYAGAGVGTYVHQRLGRRLQSIDRNTLFVAGAAAGVAAIFKAPVTGLVFALEVPYQDDLARRMLLPAATSAAASYVTFAAFAGTEPILPIAGQPPFNLADLGGAALVGLACGLLARVFTWIVRRAKDLSARGTVVRRIIVGGVVLAATVLAAEAIDGGHLALGPGYDALDWALDPDQGLAAIAALGTLRVLGTAATLGAGGTGGLFIPLVIQGALVGRLVGGAIGVEAGNLMPVVGMAAFLGAGYRVPLAAVVFVAEFTGRSGFVVPGLIAAVVAQLVMGGASISPYQRRGRVGHLEQRMRLPLSSVVDAEARTAPPDATIEEIFWNHLVGTRQHGVAIVDGDTYLGVLQAEDLTAVDRATWNTTTAEEVMRRDLPVASLQWSLLDAIRALETAGADRIAVCDGSTYIGVITTAGLIALDEVLPSDLE